MPSNGQESTNISSAEMTALWRSAYKISNDNLSSNMATPAGAKLAEEFQKGILN